MPEITLNILASDIKETDYYNSEDCAITRALSRAGRPDLQDVGRGIEYKDLNIINRFVTDWSNPSYQDLVETVLLMYGYKNPEDFTYTLTY